jgi:hypothetical protein
MTNATIVTVATLAELFGAIVRTITDLSSASRVISVQYGIWSLSGA